MWEGRDMPAEFCSLHLKERHHLLDLGIDRKVMLRSTSKKENWKVWTRGLRLGD